MKSIQLFIFIGILLLPFFYLNRVYGVYQCVSPEVCDSTTNTGTVISDESKCTGDSSGCPSGYVCCEKNWSQIVFNKDEPEEDKFKLLGVEMEAEDAKRLIKTFLLLGVSGIAFGLIGVIVYGGVLWVTAGDKEEQLQKANKTIKNGFFALLLTVGGILALAIIAGFLGVNITNDDWIDEILAT